MCALLLSTLPLPPFLPSSRAEPCKPVGLWLAQPRRSPSPRLAHPHSLTFITGSHRDHLHTRGRVVNAADSRSGGRGFDSRPCHVAVAYLP
ncbi:hypothetical protein ElyMa_004987300 [Elysia marginata]|uniref:Secreted protein n=1 Tax=Elysia marginata TaxID=1093978 RepID=A0AAV4J5J0_9GAST|nr:hypothetical protein ElyMa_004987300 [Elysia marginata]